MIRVLILYYLSIKSTHGYEIQKFIQVNHLDRWTKIQSGSIYYAIGKLEKEGLIALESESGSGPKAKKTYQITSVGKNTLRELVQKELDQDISIIGSDKFIIYPILNELEESAITAQVNTHIAKLKSKRIYLQTWQKAKLNEDSLKVEALSFQMMISNIDYQIMWHEVLLEELPQCKKKSLEIYNLIKMIDFSELEALELPKVNLDKTSKTSLESELKQFTK